MKYYIVGDIVNGWSVFDGDGKRLCGPYVKIAQASDALDAMIASSGSLNAGERSND